MPLQPGTRLGPYEITAAIGAGGMGEVYKAVDTRLDRDVAIKVLPEHLKENPITRARFEREARTISRLQHPNVCALYDVGAEGGLDFLVMEHLQGETLQERLSRGPLPIDEALAIGSQIAHGVDAAHRLGIVHRDLKPGNVMLVAGGAKILDFGLARESRRASLDKHAPTATANLTEEGRIVGTIAYMAPEQLQAQEPEPCSDVWALGCLLHEMLTAERPFRGDSQAEIIAAILSSSPTSPSERQPLARGQLDWLVSRCLQKDRRERWQSAKDLGAHLDALRSGEVPGTRETGRAQRGALDTAAGHLSSATAGHPNRRGRRSVVAAAIVSSLVLGVALGWRIGSHDPNRPRRLERWVVSAPPSRPPSVPGWLGTSEVAITPDGETVFYLYDSEEGFHNLYRRRVGELEGVVLTADLGVHSPFVSPGGEWVAFLHAGALERMPVGGGPTATLLPRRRVIRGAGWGDDGAIVLAQLTPEAGLFRLGADEHEPEKLLSLGEGEIQFAHPEVMPGSGAVLFTVRTEERSAIAVLELETRERRILIPEGSRPQYASSGHLVFGRESHLYGVPFDAAKLAVRGEPVRVLEDLVVTEWHTEGPSFSLSAAGHLVYVTEDRRSVSPRKLVWIDRRGHREDVPAPTGDFEELRISPDGRRVVLEKDAPTNRIWMWDFALGTLTPLDSEGLGYGPAWSPDGTRILFARNKPGSDHALLYERAADGSGTVRQLSEEIVFDPFSITSDEKWLVHRVLRLGNDDLDARPFDGGESLRLLSSPADERNGALSPDDRWLAYESNETGRFEIEVRPFPDVERGRWYVSSGGGRHPLWSPDGRELYYVGARGMMAAAIDVDEAGIRPQKPRLLFEWQPIERSGIDRSFDISPDGERFLILEDVEPGGSSARLDVVLVKDWFEELERLVPIG